MFVPVLFTFLVAAAKLARAIPIIDDQIRVVCVLQDGHGGLPPGIFDDVFDKFGYRAPSVYEFLKVSAVVFSAEPKILDGDAKANDKKLVKRLLRASSHLKDCSGDIVMTERFVYFSEGLSEGAAPRRLDVGLPAWPGLAQRAAKLTEAVQQSAAKADDALERYQEWQKLNNVTNAEVLPNGNSVESVIGEGDHVDVVNVIVGKGLETAKLAVDAAQELSAKQREAAESFSRSSEGATQNAKLLASEISQWRRLDEASPDELLTLYAGCDCDRFSNADACELNEHGVTVQCHQPSIWDDRVGGAWMSSVVGAVNEAVEMEADTLVILVWFGEIEDRFSARQAPRVLREVIEIASQTGVLPILPAGDEGVVYTSPDVELKDRPCDITVSGLCVSSLDDTTGARSRGANGPPVETLYAPAGAEVEGKTISACVAFSYFSPDRACDLFSHVTDQFNYPGAYSGPKRCPNAAEALDIRNQAAEESVRSIVSPGAAVPIEGQGVEAYPQAAGSAGLVDTASTLAQATQQFFEVFPMQRVFEAGYQAYTDGFFRQRGVRPLSASAVGVPKDSLPPPPGSGLPTIECHVPGMTCCVPRKTLPKWRSQAAYLNGQSEKSHCKAVYRPDRDALCVTSVYEGDKDCSTVVMEMTNYTVYRNTLIMPERTMNDAVFECSVKKNVQPGESRIIPHAFWEVSSEALKSLESTQLQQQQTAERVTGALAFAQALAAGGANATTAATPNKEVVSQVNGNSFGFLANIPAVIQAQQGRRLGEEECITMWPETCVAYRSDCVRGRRDPLADPHCVPVQLVEDMCPNEEFNISVDDVQCGSSTTTMKSLTFSEGSPFRVECRFVAIPLSMANERDACAAGAAGVRRLEQTPSSDPAAYHLVDLGAGQEALVHTARDGSGAQVVGFGPDGVPSGEAVSQLGPEHFALDAKIEVLPSDGSVVLDMFQAEKDGTFVELKPTPSFSVTQGDSEETQRGLSTLHPDPSDPPATTAADMPPIDTTSYYLVKEFHFGMDLGMASTNASELPAAIYTLRDVPPMVLRASAFADPRETTHTVMEVTLEGQAGPSLGTEDPSTTQETPTSYTTAASDMKRQRRDDDPVAGTVPVHSPFRTGVSPRDVPAGSGAGCAGPLLAVAAAVVALSV
eukprot:Polyplicarium_translucidae@DN2851_c0_g1_i1.p1